MAEYQNPFATMFSLPPSIVFGTITLWYSSVGSIPPGWSLCDGNNGTPDLRDKFIQGAGFSVSPGDTGGSTLHDHAITPDSPWLPAGTDIVSEFPTPADIGTYPDDHKHGGYTAGETSMPRYHSLLYIMYTGD